MNAYSLPTQGFVEPFPSTPKYQGVTRRKTPAERAIDDAWASGSIDATMDAVVAHVLNKYPRAIYKTFGEPNYQLADAVAFNVLRALPGYDGPAGKLAAFDETRIPLSSYTNLVAKCRHLDLTREYLAIKQHEVLASELLTGAADYSVLAHISDVQQAQQTAGWKIYEPEVRCIVTQSLSRLSPVDRSVIRACNHAGFDHIKGTTGKDFRRVEKRLRRLGRGWHARAKKYDMAAIRRIVQNAGGVLAIYQEAK